MKHFEFFVYTDNLAYGRMYLGKARSLEGAREIGNDACKGAFVIEKHLTR